MEDYNYTTYMFSEGGKYRIIKKFEAFKARVSIYKKIDLWLFSFYWELERGTFTSFLGGHIDIANRYMKKIMDKYGFYE